MTQDLKSMRVLVTPTSYAKHDPRLKQVLEETVGEIVFNPTNRPLTSAEVRDLLPGCDGFIAGLDVIDRAALETADRLKVIARYGVGVERVDLDAAQAKGICVTNTPSANSNAVAELALGLMLALARQ
ncbi:MAG: phosphoglycerate dehydrogenase, partial [Anaerolineae bacterium]|nr:phosphoglycerate dehydrogenase [Anaerolineae bacterium]